MKISVIIPAYNAEKYVEETVLSIVNQTYSNWELLICDDCSSDGTLSILRELEKKDERIKVFSNEENLKKPITVQKLVELAKGDLFTFHDADDISLPERFKKLVEAFEKNPDVFLFGHHIERISESGKPLGVLRKKVSDFEQIKNQLKTWNSDGDPSIMMRREVVDSLDWIYRPYFPNSMDYDLILRVSEKYKTSNVLEVLSYYRNVPTSISKNITSFEKLINPELCKLLAEQREERGTDDLTEQNWNSLDAIKLQLSKPYLADKTLYLRKMASFFMYVKMFQNARKYAWEAFRREPFKLANLRCFQYCIRKSMFKSI